MAAMKTFTTGGHNAKANAKKSVKFDLDGVTYEARAPKSNVLLDLAAAEDADPVTQTRALLTFMDKVFTPTSRAALKARLDDPDDDLDLTSETFLDIVNWLTEELVERPTGRSAGSTGRRPSTGSRSTGGARAGA